MKRTLVKSIVIRSIGYDASRQVLELEFLKDRVVWQYFNFPYEIYRFFIEAESKGNFFVSRIKGNYRETKVSN